MDIEAQNIATICLIRAILWRIPIFHHRCALMDIEAENITTIC
jgi:hypothetical protein